MCSENHSRTAAAYALAALLVIGVSTGCGRKEEPEPPPRKDPARTTDLKVEQRGMDLYVTMTYPATTLGGLALPGIDRLEIVQYTRPAPEFMDLPEPEDATEEGETGATTEAAGAPAGRDEDEGQPDEEEQSEDEATQEGEQEAEQDEEGEADEGEQEEGEGEGEAEAEETAPLVEPNPFLQIRVDIEEFNKNAEPVLVLEGEELEAAVVGGRIVARLPLEEIPTEPPYAYTFRAQTFAGRLKSPDSNLASFVPLPPPPPPTDVALEPEPAGIKLTWSEVETEEEIEGFNVYRRLPMAEHYPEPLATPLAEQTEYVDRSAQFGTRYVYAITTVGMKSPLVESSLSEEMPIEFVDDFAPAAPPRPVLLAESGRTRLVWDASREGDVVGYLVFVRQDGGDSVQLTPEPLETAEYIHEGTVSGATYVYFVVAVDEAGNRSEPSEEVETRAP